ncbi:MAG: hypothetical protein NC200_05745 [Candidatus Gastranaerophilales bacterium]|nr:hypothetical protein [Candidatus Gastranaerophilales bacterium]
MNIISFNNFISAKPTSFDNKYTSFQPRFGLKMAKPLAADTVSFTGEAPTNKRKNGNEEPAISIDLAQKINEMYTEPHKQTKYILEQEFKDILSTPEKKSHLTMSDRIKTPKSIQEKATTRGWSTKKEIINHMGDISGFCFVMEDKKAEKAFINRFSELVRTGKINVVEIEYHRREPLYKKNQVVKSYDSMSMENLQKLKKTVINAKNPTTQFYHEIDSMSGYSGLHITIKTPYGTMSEIQLVPRSVYNAKVPENLLYKIRNGKNVPDKFKYIEPFLAPLKVQNADKMTPQEKALQKAMSTYTREVYAHAIEDPFNDSKEFLRVEDAHGLTNKEKKMIKDYDMNTICTLVEACNELDKKP